MSPKDFNHNNEGNRMTNRARFHTGRRDRDRRGGGRSLVSQCGSLVVKGTPEQIVTKYEGLAYDAMRSEDLQQAHILFQHADHYKRVANGDQHG